MYLWLTLRCRDQDLKEHVVVSGMVGWIDSRKWPTKHSLDLDQKSILYIEMEPTLSCPPIECIRSVPTVPPASINSPSMPHPMTLVQPGPSLLLSKPTKSVYPHRCNDGYNAIQPATSICTACEIGSWQDSSVESQHSEVCTPCPGHASHNQSASVD